MIILGIDPGAKGGWAVLHNGKLTTYGRMPLMLNGKKEVADGAALIKNIPPCDVGIVEQVGVMPKQGISSAFSFGWSTGAAVTAAAVSCHELVRVTPAKWKNWYGLSSDKRASLELANAYWPDEMWKVLANDGIAEAALMCQWYVDMHP